MYFWNINALKAELRKGALPQKQQFQYALAQSFLSGIAAIQWLNNNLYDVLGGVAALVAVVIGVVYLFQCNSGADGERFLERYMSIGWVVFIRLLVLLMLPAIIVYLIAYEWLLGIPDESTVTDVIISLFLVAVYYWRCSVHMKDVARAGAA